MTTSISNHTFNREPPTFRLFNNSTKSKVITALHLKKNDPDEAVYKNEQIICSNLHQKYFEKPLTKERVEYLIPELLTGISTVKFAFAKIISLIFTLRAEAEMIPGVDKGKLKRLARASMERDMQGTAFYDYNYREKILDAFDREEYSFQMNSTFALRIYDSITQLFSLRVLNLSGCSIKVIPLSIRNLKHLESLRLDHNKIKQVTHELFKLEHLNLLDISYNEISDLPENMTRCRTLKYLHLRENKLKVLPSAIGDLSLLVSNCKNS